MICAHKITDNAATPFFMTSDHRVAGSSPAGCKSSLEADRRVSFEYLTNQLLPLSSHLLVTSETKIWLAVACTSPDLTASRTVG